MLRHSLLDFPPARAVLLAGMLALSGCTMGTEVCPAVLASSLSVRVTDAKTGAYIASGATLKWRSGASQGTGDLVVISEAADASAFIVFGPAGTYELLVEKDGYAPLQKSGIVVPSDGCGPEGVSLTVSLVPLP
jgi:hypothetical protein